MQMCQLWFVGYLMLHTAQHVPIQSITLWDADLYRWMHARSLSVLTHTVRRIRIAREEIRGWHTVHQQCFKCHAINTPPSRIGF